jgi:hypothetical protein
MRLNRIRIIVAIFLATKLCLSMAEELEGYVYVIKSENGFVHYVAFLPHALVFEHGLKGPLIVGTVETFRENETVAELVSRSFRPNPEFKDTLNRFVDIVLRKSTAIKDQAKRQNSGWVYIIDYRTPTPNGKVPPEDIIGAFEVENGLLDKYNGNPNHKLWTNNGFVSFGEDGNRIFLEWQEQILRQ